MIGLCKGMVEEGHRVDVAYSPHRLDKAFEDFIREYEGRIQFHPLGLGREVSPASDMKETLRLFRILKREGPFDIVHGHSSKGGAVARVAGRMAGVPTVYTPNGLIVASPELSGAKRFFYATVERVLGHLATTRFVAVCEDESMLAAKLRLAPKSRIAVIENAIDDDDLDATDASDESGERSGVPILGAAMRFSAQKAPHRLVEAFGILRGSRVPARLVVAGDGELFGEVERRVEEKGIGGDVSLLGWREDTKAVLGGFDVFVLPSLYEGFSYAVLEAMAAGLPIVSTNVFGAKDTVARVPGNVVVPAGDSAALAAGMREMLETPADGDLRKKLRSIGAANREHVRENFRQSGITYRIIRLYEEVANARSVVGGGVFAERRIKLRASSDAAWKRYGEEDPYFGVYSRDDFKARNLDEKTLGEFFRSGEDHVELVFENIRRHFDPGFESRRALDLGCGVGRLLIPLAKSSSHAVGVDISDHMLEEARRNCEAHGVSNVEFAKSDDTLSEVSGTFDLVHSFVVLQHIEVWRGESLVAAMIDRLQDGGVGVIHMTYHRKAPRIRKIVHRARKTLPLVNGLVNLVQGERFSLPMMQMNDYSLNRIFLVLHENGCGNINMHFTNHGGHLGVILFFQKGAATPWPMEHAD